MPNQIQGEIVAATVRALSTKRKSRTKPNDYGLTENQEAFCRLLAEDPKMTLTDAYSMAYPNNRGKRASITHNASRLWKLDYIKERVKTLRNAVIARCPVTQEEARTLIAAAMREAAQNGDIAALTTCSKELRALYPEWTEASDDDGADVVEVRIVSETRERPQRTLGQSTAGTTIIDVDNNAVETP